MYRILIADDEQIERKVLVKTLEKNFSDICELYQAENGREAFRIYEEEQIQIVILDIEMPGMNGIQTAEAIRRQDRDCCIIFLTAYDEFSYAKKAISVRALDYLLKPYQEDELISVLETAIYEIDKVISGEKKAQADEITDEAAALEAVFTPADELLDNGQVRLGMVKEAIEDYLKEHYMEDLSLQQVAQAMNYSEVYFCKLFKQCFSLNFTAHLTQFRMEEAKRLLLEPTANVKNVGEAVGYVDSSYFAKVFRRYTGSSPTEYRMEQYQRNE